MTAIRRLRAVALTGAAAVLVGGAAPAQAGHGIAGPPLLGANVAERPFIQLALAGQPGQTMFVSEQDGRALRPLAEVVLDPVGHAFLLRAGRWRCDRRSRRFVATLQPGGAPVATYGVRTPSCRRRLSVGLPRSARAGVVVRVAVRDRWRIGGLRLRFCVDPPAGPRHCRAVNLARERAYVTTRFRPGRRGRWRTALHGPGIRIAGALTVGKPPQRASRGADRPSILVAGDSLMQGLDGFLGDRLADRARVFRDVVPNSGISKPRIDWLRKARDRSRRLQPDATVVLLGANEGFPQVTPAGQAVECCDAPWAAEFTRRVREMMRSYARGGRAKVLWLNVPQVRAPERQSLQVVVNAAILRAARGLRGVRIVRLDRVLTPGGRYRDVISYRGRRVRVREADGLHLSLHGAAIAADEVLAALRSEGVVR